MFCEECGAKIIEGAKFCEQCGTPVPTIDMQTENMKKSKPPFPTKKFFLVGSIVVGVLFLLVGFVMLVMMRSGGRQPRQLTNQSQQMNSQSAEDEQETTSTPVTTEPPVDTEEDSETMEETDETEEDYVEEEVPPFQKGCVTSIAATSELSERGMTHYADRISDGSLTKAWVEGASGVGIGESVTFKFDDEYRVEGMNINAGYQKTKSLYKKNARPKKIRVIFSDGTSEDFVLKDRYGKQMIEFSQPVDTEEITVEIKSVYRGSKYEDTVISELQWY